MAAFLLLEKAVLFLVVQTPCRRPTRETKRAESLPADHWLRGPQGGGRLVGEACHMIDLLQFLVGVPRRDHRLTVPPVVGSARTEDFSLACSYADGQNWDDTSYPSESFASRICV